MSLWHALRRWWQRLFATQLERQALQLLSVPPISFRAFVEADTARCLELYRLNELGRFPEGLLAQYEKALRERPAEYLAVELAGEVIATCGMARQSRYNIGVLSYGLIAPEHQGKGIGTVMLLMRLLLLLRSTRGYYILATMIAVDASRGFYRRFGFQRSDLYWDYPLTAKENPLQLWVSKPSLFVLEAALERLGISIPSFVPAEVILPDTAEPPP